MNDKHYTAREKALVLSAAGRPAQRWCPVCGRTDSPISMHHPLPRSLGGDRLTDDQRLPLCVVCHEAADNQSLKGHSCKLLPRAGGERWDVQPLSEEYAAYLSERRSRATGHPVSVQPGAFYPLIFEAEGVDLYVARQDDHELAILADEVRRLDEREAGAWRAKAERAARASVIAVSKRDYADWRCEARISAGAASKMLTVCAHLERDECCTRPAELQYQLARAIRDEVGKRAELIADAEALSPSDWLSKWRGKPTKAERQACAACEHCTRTKCPHRPEEV